MTVSATTVIWNCKKTHLTIALQNTWTKHFKVYSLSNLIFTINLQRWHYTPQNRREKSLVTLPKVTMLVNGRILKNNENVLLQRMKSWYWKMEKRSDWSILFKNSRSDLTQRLHKYQKKKQINFGFYKKPLRIK